MIILTDTFNAHEISRHRTIEAAIKAQRKHLRALKKDNCFITYKISDSTGKDIREEVQDARIKMGSM